MTINYALLGILSYKPLTGYDLKKIMQDSPFMYWSGNNNQIYKVLVELLGGGFVINEVHHRDGAPSRKVYSITAKGLEALKQWSLTAPEAPEFKKAFLVQLAWTWQLSHAEITSLLDRYAREVQGHLLIAEDSACRFAPDRTPRESAVFSLIYENVMESYQRELDWIDRVRKRIGQFKNDNPGVTADTVANSTAMGDKNMRYELMEKEGNKYVYLGPVGKQIEAERDGLGLVAICAQHGTSLLLIDSARLSDAFFQLKTGVAGAVMQKLTQYNIKVAVTLDHARIHGKFKEYLKESNRGSLFRTYDTITDAEKWLLKNE